MQGPVISDALWGAIIGGVIAIAGNVLQYLIVRAQLRAQARMTKMQVYETDKLAALHAYLEEVGKLSPIRKATQEVTDFSKKHYAACVFVSEETFEKMGELHRFLCDFASYENLRIEDEDLFNGLLKDVYRAVRRELRKWR